MSGSSDLLSRARSQACSILVLSANRKNKIREDEEAAATETTNRWTRAGQEGNPPSWIDRDHNQTDVDRRETRSKKDGFPQSQSRKRRFWPSARRAVATASAIAATSDGVVAVGCCCWLLGCCASAGS